VLARQVPGGSAVSATWRALAIAIAYFIADTLLNKLALGDGWAIFWPLNGITIALLIRRPRHEWPLLLAAIALGTGIGEYLDDNTLASAVIQRAFSVFEVALSAALLPPFVTLDSWLRLPRLYPRFAAAVLVGPVASGVLAAAYFNVFDATPFWTGFNGWALADAMGIAAVLPLSLSLSSADLGGLRDLRRLALAGGTLVPAFAIMVLIFVTSRYPLIFVLYPLLMLVDWMLGLLGSSIALCAACVMAVFLTEHGYGPFANPTELGISRNLAVQVYLGFHLIGFLPISILFLQQRRMDQELRDSLARADKLASLDSLTGVANRRTLDTRLDEQWDLAARHQSPLALLMIDADHFKEFNDRLGHQAGDACLRAIAAAMSRRVSRPADVVARFGGEEFAVLLPDTPLEGARHVAEIIRTAVEQLAIAHPGKSDPAHVTVSIGCAALVPPPGSGAGVLVELADRALYEAKRSGRDRVCFVDPGADIYAWIPGTAMQKLRARIESHRQLMVRR
jgi:diguanylate cyclase (GGDEF)-like protein